MCFDSENDDERELDFEVVHELLKDNIINALPQSNNAQDVVFGASGYLYSLLSIENKFQENFDYRDTEPTLMMLQNSIA